MILGSLSVLKIQRKGERGRLERGVNKKGKKTGRWRKAKG